MMYIIFPFTGFIQDSCPAARHRRACSAALRFHPLAVYKSEVALQEKPQVFLLMPFGWGKAVTDEIQAGKVGEK